jgi:hypothetical protein
LHQNCLRQNRRNSNTNLYNQHSQVQIYPIKIMLVYIFQKPF